MTLFKMQHKNRMENQSHCIKILNHYRTNTKKEFRKERAKKIDFLYDKN